MLGEMESPLGALRFTPRAMREVNAAFGSFGAMYQQLMLQNAEAFIAVAAAGLGKKSKDVEDAVFVHGMPDLVEPFSKYVQWLANGGKEPKVDEGSAPKGEA